MFDAQSVTPVFICGYPKSGTTLLLALLDRHPDLLVFPEETRFLTKIMPNPDRQNLDYVLQKTGVHALLQGEHTYPSGYRDYSMIDAARYQAAVSSSWMTSDQSVRALMESIIMAYAQESGQSDTLMWVEKTPLNELYLFDALRLWPGMKAVYILRDPRDNYVSYYKKRQADGLTLYPEEFVYYWGQSMLAWLKFSQEYPEDSLLVRYEDLVFDPETQMRQVADFLSINWDEILLQPTRNGVFWSGNSMYGSVFSGISATSVGRYKTLLSGVDIQIIEFWLNSIFSKFGWPRESEQVSFYISLRSLLELRGTKISLRLKMLSLITRLRQVTV